jgi:hypothetical protein
VARVYLKGFIEEDIDSLLDAVPVSFDFSLSRHHFASRGNDGPCSPDRGLGYGTSRVEVRLSLSTGFSLDAFKYTYNVNYNVSFCGDW